MALHALCWSGTDEEVLSLLEKGENIDGKDEYSRTPFHIACEAGNKEVVSLLLSKNVDTKAKNLIDMTGFHFACFNNHTHIVELLLKNNDSLVSNEECIAGLNYACMNKSLEVLEFLIDYDSNLMKQVMNEDGETCFDIACTLGCDKILKLFLKKDPSLINLQDKDGFTGFHRACQLGNLETVQTFLDFDSKLIHQPGPFHQTGFLLACLKGKKNIVEYSLKKDPKVMEHKTFFNQTPLTLGVEGGKEIIEVLLSHDVSLAPDSLIGACQIGSCEILRFILTCEAVNIEKQLLTKGYFIASEGGKTDIVKILLAYEPTLISATKDGKTSFYVACESGHVDLGQLLLENDPFIMAIGMDEKKPRQIAEENQHEGILSLIASFEEKMPLFEICRDGDFMKIKEFLNLIPPSNGELSQKASSFMDFLPQTPSDIEIGFRVGFSNKREEICDYLIQNFQFLLENEETFHSLCCLGQEKLICFYLKHNPLILSSKNEIGETPLQIANRYKHLDVVKTITDFCDPNEPEFHLAMAFFKCCQHDCNLNSIYQVGTKFNSEIIWAGFSIASKKGFVSELLKKEPSLLETKDKDGWNALHYATFRSNSRLVQELLDKNISFLEKDNNGKSAQDMISYSLPHEEQKTISGIFHNFSHLNSLPPQLSPPSLLFKLYHLSSIDLSSLPPFSHLPPFLSYCSKKNLKKCVINIEGGGVDEWVMKEYEGEGEGVGGEEEEEKKEEKQENEEKEEEEEGEGERREEEERLKKEKEERKERMKIELMIEFAKLYRWGEGDTIPNVHNNKKELNLSGFSLKNEFFRRLSASKHIPFHEISSIDLRNTSLTVSVPCTPLPGQEKGEKKEIFDLSFLSLCDENTLSSLFLPPDHLGPSSPLSPLEIQGVIRLAKNLKKNKNPLHIDLTAENISKIEEWVLESLVDWEEVTELILNNRREEKREIEEEDYDFYNFLGRLGGRCIIKLKNGDKFENLDGVEMLYMRAVGGVKRTWPYVDLSGFNLRPEIITRLTNNSSLKWSKAKTVNITNNPLLVPSSSFSLLMFCSFDDLVAFYNPAGENILDRIIIPLKENTYRANFSSFSLKIEHLKGQKEWVFLKNFQRIDLSSNQLTTIPSFIRFFDNVEVWFLDNNPLKEFSDKVKTAYFPTFFRSLFRALYNTYPEVDLSTIPDIVERTTGRVPHDEIIDNLHEFIPDEEYWKNIQKIRFPEPQKIPRIPLFLAYTDSLSDSEMDSIFLDLFGENRKDIRGLLKYLANVNTNLDLSNKNITNSLANLLPFHCLKKETILKVDLTENPSLSVLPSGLWNQTEIKEIICDVKNFSGLEKQYLEESMRNNDYRRILELLKLNYIGGKTKMNEIKLMLVGASHAGKTCLRKYLQSKNAAVEKILDRDMTDGIDFVEIKFEQYTNVKFNVGDFGGHRAFRYSHQIFYQDHAQYLVMFDITRPEEGNIEEVKRWISSIEARVRQTSEQGDYHFCIYLVGTQADKLEAGKNGEEMANRVKTAVQSYFPHLTISNKVFSVSVVSKDGKSEIQKLIQLLSEEAQKYLKEAPAIIDQIKESCLKRPSSPHPPFLPFKEFIARLEKLANDISLPWIMKPETVRLIWDSLEKLGKIVVLRSHVAGCPPEGLFLSPEWVSRLFSTVVTPRAGVVHGGVLSKASLSQIWQEDKQNPNKNFPPSMHSTFLSLLEQLDVLVPYKKSKNTSREQYLVPCLLQDTVPSSKDWKKVRDGAHKRQVWLDEGCGLEAGFMPRILCRMANHFPNVEKIWKNGLIGGTSKGVIFKISYSKKPPPSDKTCASGIINFFNNLIRQEESGSSCAIRKPLPCIDIEICSQVQRERFLWSQEEISVIRKLTSIIETILSSYYSLSYHITIPCPSSSSCYFKFSQHIKGDSKNNQRDSDITKALDSEPTKDGQFLASCTPKGHKYSLGILCPDATFQDFGNDNRRGNFIINYEKDLTIKDIIGQGGFGTVYLAELKQNGAIQKVAVKVEKEEKDEPNADDEFIAFGKEVWFMSVLTHPNIVKVLGVCYKPRRAIVMEILEGGDLFSYLHDPLGIQKSVDKFTKNYTPNKESMEKQKFLDFPAKIREKYEKWTKLCPSNELTSLWEEFYPLLECYYQGEKDSDGNIHLSKKAKEELEKSWDKLYDFYLSSLDKICGTEYGTDSFWPIRLKFMLDVARGMQGMHAHNPPLIHRDLKTPNIFLRAPSSKLVPVSPQDNPFEENLCAVADFGLSIFHYGHHHRAAGDIGQSINPTWAAPEILDKENIKYNEKSDVYPMGIIIFEIFTRTTYFQGFSPEDLRESVLRGVRPPIPNTCPEKLKELIESCWEQDYRKRPSYDEIVYKLERFAEELTPNLPKPPKPASSSSPEGCSLFPALPCLEKKRLRSGPQSYLLSNDFPVMSESSMSLRGRCEFCSHGNYGFGKNSTSHCASCNRRFCPNCAITLPLTKDPLTCPLVSRSRSSPFLAHSSGQPSSLSSSSSSPLSSSSPPTSQSSSSSIFSRPSLFFNKQAPSFQTVCVLCGLLKVEKKKCPKPKCEVLCAAEGEGLWFGMRDGSVGAIFEGQEHQEPTDKKMIWAFSDDCHSGAVRSMVYQEGGNGGKIWSGCDEGTLIAWEARKVGVEDGIELPSSVYGGMFMVEEAGKDEDEGVWITVEEGLLKWGKTWDRIHDYQPPKSIRLLTHLIPSSYSGPHITTLNAFTENKLIIKYSGGEIVLRECTEEEFQKRKSGEMPKGDLSSLYLLIRRVFLSSLLSVYGTDDSNHLSPIASTVTGAIGEMKEIEGNIWTSFLSPPPGKDYTLCEWFLDDVSAKKGQWFYSPVISPLRTFSFPKMDLKHRMVSVGSETWLNCEEKFYSLNSRGGIEKIEIATLPTIWRENENQVNPGVQSLFLLLSKGERDMVNCFPESFPPDKYDTKSAQPHKQWIVAVGQGGMVWVWDAQEEKIEGEGGGKGKENENEERERRPHYRFKLDLEWGSLFSFKIHHESDEFWIGDRRGDVLYCISLVYWPTLQRDPFLVVEKVDYGDKTEGIREFCVIDDQLCLASERTVGDKKSYFVHYFSKFNKRGGSFEGKKVSCLQEELEEE